MGRLPHTITNTHNTITHNKMGGNGRGAKKSSPNIYGLDLKTKSMNYTVNIFSLCNPLLFLFLYAVGNNPNKE